MKLIAIGDNVCDCYIDENIFFPGGNCVNVAVHAKRCGAQAVNYTGVFGNDFMADYIMECLSKENVTTTNSRRMYAETSQPCVKLVDGDRVFVGGKPDSCQRLVAMKMTKTDLEFAKGFDVCHISCYSNMENELKVLAGAVPLSFDFSDIKDDEYFKKVCPHLEYAFASGGELTEEECKSLAEKLYTFGAKTVVVTRGSKGSLCFDGKQFYYQGIAKVDAVDTMGAGDSYIAAFLVHYTNNNDIQKAMEAAAEYSAQNCTKRGAIGYAHVMPHGEKF